MGPKKIFLTEEQISFIIKKNKTPLTEGFLRNWYEGCSTFQDYFQKTVSLVSIGAISVTLAIGILERCFPEETAENKNEITQNLKNVANMDNSKTINFNDKKDELFERRVNEVDSLMKYVAELNGKNPEMIKLSAKHIVKMCEKYNFPLPLLLAQAHLESHFGTTPRAIRTNSVFSVGSYDDGRDVYQPSSQNHSVENYIKTIQKYYLADKTIDELLQDGNFINHQGNRYASDKNYERKIRQTMQGLIKKHCPSCF